jgi:hypothetical protein
MDEAWFFPALEFFPVRAVSIGTLVHMDFGRLVNTPGFSSVGGTDNLIFAFAMPINSNKIKKT